MARFVRPRLAVIFCGGTALARAAEPWERVTSLATAERWLRHIPELHLIADTVPVPVMTKPGTPDAERWRAIAIAVKSQIRSVDGVLVLHDLETIPFTANALSLMLPSLPIPVVIAGSPQRGSGVRAPVGARANLINAAQVATADIAGVCVVFGNRIIPADMVRLDVRDGTIQLIAPADALLGRVDFGITLSPVRTKRSARTLRAELFCDPSVVVLAPVPGSTMPLARAIDDHIHGIVVRMSGGIFSVPGAVMHELDRAARCGIPVVVTSATRIVGVPKRYISLPNVTESMAVVKPMWAIGKGRQSAAVRALLERRPA